MDRIAGTGAGPGRRARAADSAQCESGVSRRLSNGGPPPPGLPVMNMMAARAPVAVVPGQASLSVEVAGSVRCASDKPTA